MGFDPSRAAIKAGEDRAFGAWPADQCLACHGWVLRRTPRARTRRANSVCTTALRATVLGASSLRGEPSLDELIAQVETFYGGHGIKPRFQISPAVDPTDLDARLAARGYQVEAPTLVQWAACSDVQGTTPDAGDVQISDTMLSSNIQPGWNTVHRDASISDEDLAGRNAIISRIRGERALVLVNQDGQPAATGLGVFEDGWCGVFCMHTLPRFRRQGLADRTLAALADWTVQQAGTEMYLQVQKDNAVALAFYEARGFSTAYGYHYRTLFT